MDNQEYQSPDIATLKQNFDDYLWAKSLEIEEQKDARRYYHGAQLTEEQRKELKRRKQPPVIYNRIAKKVNAIVGFMKGQRQDPKAYARTPKHEDAAELATACLRFVLDDMRWDQFLPRIAHDSLVDGVAAISLDLKPSRNGDYDLMFERISPENFFYDPCSVSHDFSDAAYLGSGEWVQEKKLKRDFPGYVEGVSASYASDLDTSPDYSSHWAIGTRKKKSIRVVTQWYKEGDVWRWCMHTSHQKLAEGVSPYVNEDGESQCGILALSANVDQDGDRYGFIRNMKSSQDEINSRRSRALHVLHSRRVIAQKSDSVDIDEIRREAARPDGVILYELADNPPQFDDAAKNSELQGQLAFLQDARDEIENYGFNPALIGSGVQDMSGRAIRLMQEAGIAELGSYFNEMKDFRLRLYRLLWATIKRYWTQERYIRVTDGDNVVQFIGINQVEMSEYGQVMPTNALHQVDVDIILDEGNDAITMQADAYETLTLMAGRGQQVPFEILLELAPLASSVKKRILEISKKAKQDPMQAQAAQIQMQQAMSDIEHKNAQTQKTLSEITENQADTGKTIAETQKTEVETLLLGNQPQQEVRVYG